MVLQEQLGVTEGVTSLQKFRSPTGTKYLILGRPPTGAGVCCCMIGPYMARKTGSREKKVLQPEV